MAAGFKELKGLNVNVEKVVYMPHLDASADRPHPFVYYITIQNLSPEAVVIKGRKWVVTDSAGQKTVIEGDGVVGKFPRLEPGEEFSYNSYHTVGSDSVAEGSFLGLCDSGTPVLARIPKFTMRVPQ